MRVELLSIGSELLNGNTVNTNAAYLSKYLNDLGFPCAQHTVVADDAVVLTAALKAVLERAELVITTGGLGPTQDDLTVASIAAAAGRPLVFSDAVWEQIRLFYTNRKRRKHAEAKRQAYIPQGAVALPNPLGTAPGIWLQTNGCTVVALPGVPREMEAIMRGSVLGRLKRLPGRERAASCFIRTVGVPELDIQRELSALKLPKSVSIGLYPHLHTVDIRLWHKASTLGEAKRKIGSIERRLVRRLGHAVYTQKLLDLEDVVAAQLKRKRLSLAVAESCTGGLFSSRLTDVPGSSKFLIGSLVAYSNRVKMEMLGVSASALKRYGAVSAAVARSMARGVRSRFGADIGVAITGIAGPGGAAEGKPVGLVYFCVDSESGTAVEKRYFVGTRESIKLQATQVALSLLRLH